MRVVSPLLRRVVYPGLAKSGFFRRGEFLAPAIVTYHGMIPPGYKVIDSTLDGNLISAESFRRQLEFLTTHFEVISPDKFLRWCEGKQELPQRAVLLTCDDGLQNVLEMTPILQEFGLSCLHFVTGASLCEAPTMLWHEELYLMLLAANRDATLDVPGVGRFACVAGKEKRLLWGKLVRKLSRLDGEERRSVLGKIRLQLALDEEWSSEYLDHTAASRRFRVLTRDELMLLDASGMCIGAHTISHPVLSEASAELAWGEIRQCHQNLEQALGKPVWALAYPYGDFCSVGTREIRMAEEAGFVCAFMNVEAKFGTQLTQFAMPRIHVTAQMSMAEFEAHISGFHGWLRQRLMPSRSAVLVGEA